MAGASDDDRTDSGSKQKKTKQTQSKSQPHSKDDAVPCAKDSSSSRKRKKGETGEPSAAAPKKPFGQKSAVPEAGGPSPRLLDYVTKDMIDKVSEQAWAGTKSEEDYKRVIMRIFIKGHPGVPCVYHDDFKTSVELTLNAYRKNPNPIKDNGKHVAAMKGILKSANFDAL